MRSYRDDATFDPPDRPGWVDTVDNPYLHGPYAPVVAEVTAFDLEVVAGEIPADLYGAYLRNGPNPVLPPRGLYHWFDGDGMVHGVYFRDGRASYRNRWVRTRALREELDRGRVALAGIMGPFDLDRLGSGSAGINPDWCKDTSNTTLTLHHGRVLSQWYNSGRTYALDPLTLDTVKQEDFGGAVPGTLNAHAKCDPRTGELVDYGYSDFDPGLTYCVVGADGGLRHHTRIELPGPRLPHDTTITVNYTVLHDFPLYHDVDLLRRTGHRIVQFHRDRPSRFGVVPRYGTQADVRWFEFEPGYVLHMVNAWEDGDWIVMDGCFQPDPTIRRDPAEGVLGSMLAYLRYRGHLRRWRMNLRTGEAREEQRDDLNVEFCLPDAERYGVATRYSYHQRIPTDFQTLAFDALVKYDHVDGTREVYEYPPGWYPSEAPFARGAGAAADAAAEDRGYVITVAIRGADYRAEAWIFDAQGIAAGPIARVRLPARVPLGFHATWVPGRHVWSTGTAEQ